MNRHQKEAIVADVKRLFTESHAAFLVHYKGLDVAHMQTLRRGLRAQQGLLKVTKTSLMKIAATGIDGIETLSDQFQDQVALVFVQNSDISGVAKHLVSFSKNNETLKVLSGVYESKVLHKDEIVFLASLPSREVLLAQLAGTLQAPIAAIPRMLNMMIVKLVCALNEIAEKKEK